MAGLMTREHKMLLQSKHACLQEFLVMDEIFIGLLFQERVITDLEREKIGVLQIRMQRVDAFLGMLRSKADSAFYSFRQICFDLRLDNSTYGMIAEELGLTEAVDSTGDEPVINPPKVVTVRQKTQEETDGGPPTTIPWTLQNFSPDGYEQTKNNAYPMFKEFRGGAHIFSLKTFDDPACKTRDGTDDDAKHLQQLFTDLHFHVNVYDDAFGFKEFGASGLTADNILKLIKEVAGKLSSADQCVVVCVLSHGARQNNDDKIVGKDGKYLSIREEFLKPLDKDHCKSFSGPRLAFFQCCREVVPESKDGFSDSWADFLIGYATQPATVSLRRPTGSWYIYYLVKTIVENAHMLDVSTMLKEAEKEMKVELYKTSGRWQEPCHEDYLAKKVYFYKGIVRQ